MIHHTHAPDAVVGDQVDAHITGVVEAIEHDGRILIRYPTTDDSHAWVRLDPAAAGVGVSVANHGGTP
ncbi:hypothetical protein [Nocardiopsis sp. YSL2]|uniref:hypothetical protein n=1 Tax=Nocardiopsis sp. YSL2 TaxID=2939492 RepID=UPI0026F447BE|nr:hypothetical protein [Nocardiopsis sp. YSL2]